MKKPHRSKTAREIAIETLARRRATEGGHNPDLKLADEPMKWPTLAKRGEKSVPLWRGLFYLQAVTAVDEIFEALDRSGFEVAPKRATP